MQRVSAAQVSVKGDVIGKIDAGLLIFVCAMQGDDAASSARLAGKISKLRIFRDENGRMNRALSETGGSALIVSQFTLAADTSRGNRPGFGHAADPETGKSLYQTFINDIKACGIQTATGEFGADMAVSLTNDGPVTIWLDV